MPVVPPWNSADAGSGATNAWDTLYIEDVRIPGLCEIDGKIGTKIDVQPVKGQKGAKTTNEGPDPATLSIKLRLATSDEVHELTDILDSLHPRKADQKAVPLRITYPSVNFLGVDRILIKEVGFPKIEGDVFTWTIQAIEYFEEPKAAKPTTTKPKGKGSPKPAPSKADSYEANLTGTSAAGNDPLSVMNRQPAPNPWAQFPDPEVGWV